jgi:hypothetical protein
MLFWMFYKRGNGTKQSEIEKTGQIDVETEGEGRICWSSLGNFSRLLLPALIGRCARLVLPRQS